ncbi:MAG TPA: DUF4476 domain-containing protein [Ferruginibacter sp.]|nr:DUF4476 domain-containing protein [Ferruginibacter sp.]HRO05064.1 DUF4476 domain-containing protein [Ferruginibacter sp.]HRO95631.1 DUF4476 domain-containing protein [Ferruginibacter sp.]HRP49510.1 DUF4476 domain-containing protein [Ferruginibacter sp.]
MMLRILLLLLLPVFSYAQPTGSLIIVSEQGDPFYLYLNGQKMNDTAVTKIRLDGLSGEYYTVKADFKSSAIQAITKRLYLMDDNFKMSDATYRIRKDKSGKARFVFFSMQTPNHQYKPEAGMKVIYFNRQDNEPASEMNPASEKEKTPEGKREENSILTNVKGATVSVPNTKAPETKAPAKKAETPTPQKEINQPEAAKEKPKNVSVADKAEVKKEVKSETAPAAKKEVKPAAAKEAKAEVKKEVKSEAAPVVKKEVKPAAAKEAKAEVKKEDKAEAYPSKKCNDWPMMKADFLNARKSVEDAKTDKQKLAKAKEMAAANCLLVSQISDVSALITDEKMKLEFVQYAYGFTIDKNNYQRLEKLFTGADQIATFKKFYQSRTQE